MSCSLPGACPHESGLEGELEEEHRSEVDLIVSVGLGGVCVCVCVCVRVCACVCWSLVRV